MKEITLHLDPKDYSDVAEAILVRLGNPKTLIGITMLPAHGGCILGVTLAEICRAFVDYRSSDCINKDK